MPWPTPMHIAAMPYRPPVRREVMDEGGEDARARRTERVTDRDRPAERVHDRGIELRPLAQARQALGGEGLVELDGSTGRPSRCRPVAARCGRPRPGRCRRDAVRRRSWPRRRTRAIGSRPVRARPACDVTSMAAEPSFIGDALPAVTVPPSARNTVRSSASFSIVVSAADALVALDAGDRHDLGREMPGVPGRVGPLVRSVGEDVLFLAGDRVLVGEQLGALAERHGPRVGHLGVRHPPPEGGAPQLLVPGRIALGRLLQHPRRARHALDPTGDDDVGVADRDRTAGGDDRFEPGAAQTIDRRPRDRRRQARQQHRHPRDVAVVLARLVGVAEVRLVDRGRIEVGGSFDASARTALAARSSGRTPASAPPIRPIGVRTASTM